MLRSLLAACSILVLLISTILFPTDAKACPVKSPETLLSLYRKSDAIYIARYDKTVDHEVVEDTDERTVVATRQHFDISSALKGENQKLFVLEDRDYRYKNEVPEIKSEEPEDEEADALYRRPELKSGDTVLLFLTINRESKQLELTDYRDAIKKLSPERLSAYEARISDLNSIFSAKKVDDAAIVDWLIRCTQDPLTRWEGAFELQQAYERMLWQDQRKEQLKKEANKEANKEEVSDDTDSTSEAESADDQSEASDEAQVPEQAAQTSDVAPQSGEFILDGEPASSWVDTTVYARMLTDNHKQLLTNTLLDSVKEETGNDKKKSNLASPGDQALLELVSNWGDTSLARFLIDKIQVAGVDNYAISQLMWTAARVLKDEQLYKIAQDYSNAFYQEDNEAVEDSEEPADEAEAEDEASSDDAAVASTEAATEAEAENETADVVEASADESALGADSSAPTKMTYKEFRAELLVKFLERSSVAIANAESKQIEKAGK